MSAVRTLARLAAAVAVLLCGTAVVAVSVPAANRDGDEVALAPLFAAWPDEYTVAGTKSEPLYVEHIRSTRQGDVFGLEIDIAAQGSAAGGVQRGAVHVHGDGRIEWLAGCHGSDCADDRRLRGFLSAAAVLSAERRGALPATGVLRDHGGTWLVCIPDAALHPDAAPAVTDLDPCFSRATGALLAHYSERSDAFVGPTISPEGLSDEAVPDTDLLHSLIT